MKKFKVGSLLSMVTALGLAPTMFFQQSRLVLAQDQNVQVIEVTAKKYEYSPSPVHVKAGTNVQLEITATDRDHGFKIGAAPDDARANGTVGLIFSSPRDCWQLKQGEATTIEFVARTPGTYTFRCCHSCGIGHRGMKGQIVVD
jgi:heme/copper-type cytochrome/quinol oxidase subunit 2